MKNKTTAAVLAFLLGGFAADQLYLNERPKRLWWLLLPPVAGVLALIAAIRYLTMSRRSSTAATTARPANDAMRSCPGAVGTGPATATTVSPNLTSTTTDCVA